MIIPYGTDAPIYFFPRTTLTLIVFNTLIFFITGMGRHDHGWLLSYGHGLHPVEWVAYSFFHDNFLQLVENMYFLWTFGIVVEGKLGWWKFLLLYLSIGILGGVLIQTAMLSYDDKQTAEFRNPNDDARWVWRDNSLFAQEAPPRKNADGQGTKWEVVPAQTEPQTDEMKIEIIPEDAAAAEKEIVELVTEIRTGARGASLIIYGLMAIVLIWAPQNEIHCIWLFFFRAGTIDVEYFHFCSCFILIEVLQTIFGSTGFIITTEIGHVLGAMIGFGLGALFVQQRWVDCENWDLLSIIRGQHQKTSPVGDWQSPLMANPDDERGLLEANFAQESNTADAAESPKFKKKRKPKLVELESFDDDTVLLPDQAQSSSDEDFTFELSSELEMGSFSLTPAPSGSQISQEMPTDPSGRINLMLLNNEYQAAWNELRMYQVHHPNYQLPKAEHRILTNGLFKARAVEEAAPLLLEFIGRFDKDADRERIKLAVLYVKYRRRPTEALRLLAKVNGRQLAADYQSIYRKTAQVAQQMVAEGVTDLNE